MKKKKIDYFDIIMNSIMVVLLVFVFWMFHQKAPEMLDLVLLLLTSLCAAFTILIVYAIFSKKFDYNYKRYLIRELLIVIVIWGAFFVLRSFEKGYILFQMIPQEKVLSFILAELGFAALWLLICRPMLRAKKQK